MTFKSKPRTWEVPFRTSAGRFYNYEGEHSASVLIASAHMLLKTITMRLYNHTSTHDMSDWHVPEYQHTAIPDFSITWLGHASFLIKLGGKTIITDPIFGSPSFLFPRLFPFTLSMAHMGQIDCALISHNHYDHLDLATLKRISHRAMMVYVPRGDGEFLRSHKIKNVYELSWWQSYTLSTTLFKSIKLTFLPAFHWSGRTLFDRNRSLWGGWMLEYDGFTIYFAGDTAYAEHFQQIKERFGHISVALLPIAPAEPREHMCLTHLGPEEAGQAFLDLKAHVFVPMHWGTFQFGSDEPVAPLSRLKAWWNMHTNELGSRQLHILRAYESLPLLAQAGLFVPEHERPKQSLD